VLQYTVCHSGPQGQEMGQTKMRDRVKLLQKIYRWVLPGQQTGRYKTAVRINDSNEPFFL